jgi:hypothetical protein
MESARLRSIEFGRIEVVLGVGTGEWSACAIFPMSMLCPRACLSWIGDAGGWGSGRRDCRTLLYALSGLDSLLPPYLFSMAEGAIPVASLSPRL